VTRAPLLPAAGLLFIGEPRRSIRDNEPRRSNRDDQKRRTKMRRIFDSKTGLFDSNGDVAVEPCVSADCLRYA
jgi:hypothetical protein